MYRDRPSLKILYITTKPPWPTTDGSRLLVMNTLEGLAQRGHRVTLVAPADFQGVAVEEVAANLREICSPCLIPAQLPSLPGAFVRSRWKGRPLSIDRHSRSQVREEVARQLDQGHFDLVHVEQLQALPQAEPALERSIPVVLRAQNVESDLWAATAKKRPILRSLAQRENHRLAAWETEALGRVDLTIALTRRDAERLRQMAGGRARIRLSRVPFMESLPQAGEPLPGEPAVVIFGSEGWFPNRDAVSWFARRAWPTVRARLPGAWLHVFGNWNRALAAEGATRYSPPQDSRDAFPPGSVMVVPLRIASGVRMKILEAWARGVPVIALPEAAAGLEATEGKELLLARNADQFAASLVRLQQDPALRARLIAAGRAILARWHRPSAAAARLEEIYREAMGEGLESVVVGKESGEILVPREVAQQDF
ncbi:MAG: glycosyltransferase family 4 protein [Deltaproteobacteria bacterium]|nr:glycosyltransferase family 4 protein [Deltaproteobacteria bacterium]